MALLERVSTLVRANLNDLIDKAEEPEKMIKQVILDMQNQLLQVKTQVAIAIADQHLLEKKQKENEDKVAEWMRKAELSVDKKQDDLARASLQRVESYREMSESFAQQVADQKAQVENLKSALRQLEQKLSEAQAKADLLIAQHRRARAVGKASDARMAMGDGSKAAAFDRMKRKVAHSEAVSQAKAEIAGDNMEDRLAALEKEDRIEQLLAELKGKRGRSCDRECAGDFMINLRSFMAVAERRGEFLGSHARGSGRLLVEYSFSLAGGSYSANRLPCFLGAACCDFTRFVSDSLTVRYRPGNPTVNKLDRSVWEDLRSVADFLDANSV